LKKELNIFTFNDLLHHFPFRHLDRTRVTKIAELNSSIDFAQIKGRLISFEVLGEKGGKRLIASLKDETGVIELTWFQGLSWVEKTLNHGEQYLAFGRISFFMGKPQIVHPEIELVTAETTGSRSFLEPVYSTTEKLKARSLGSRNLGKMMQSLFALLTEKDLLENLPAPILEKGHYLSRYQAYRQIHYPANMAQYDQALNRLKFEELFITQIRLSIIRSQRHRYSKGVVFDKVGDLFNTFYHKHLPFQLTGAQKRVIKEIRIDTAKGHQMNRLLQGDVGSGKTIVALLTCCWQLIMDINVA
jgi:ATP-dependent DNA helicase RecG